MSQLHKTWKSGTLMRVRESVTALSVRGIGFRLMVGDEVVYNGDRWIHGKTCAVLLFDGAEWFISQATADVYLE